MTTFAALGDSITLGVGDPAPGGGWRGWAEFLAQSLPGGQLVNLAANGARAADVERAQLPRALELRPDVASVIVGTNDILRASFDAAAEAVAYERRMWCADRLHPSERGHRYIAGCFHDRLAAHGQLVGPRPAAEPTSPPPTRYHTAAWMATKGTAWVLRRSTDLLPYLLLIALRECWPGPGPAPQPSPATAQPAATEQGPAPQGAP